MGDKGGKKDKEKNKQQQLRKQKEEEQRKQEGQAKDSVAGMQATAGGRHRQRAGRQSPVRENHERRCARPAHSRGARAAVDVNIPTPTHAERARTLVARISTGTLCTLALEPEGYPYGSFVTVAFDHGNPIFLISELAEHTKNLERILARRCW